MRIAQFSASDMDNYGDLLYPVVMQRLLPTLLNKPEMYASAFLEGPAPGEAGYEVLSVHALHTLSPPVDALLIGGGDILRTDSRVLASHYTDTYRQRLEKTWHGALQSKLLGARGLTNAFLRKKIRHVSPGPFFLEKSDVVGLQKVAYCSSGVPFFFQESDKPKIKKVMDNADFIYVRDESSKIKLLDAGVTNAVHIAPDLIVILSDFFDAHQEKEKGKAILRRCHVDTNLRALCFQINALDDETIKLILPQLLDFKKQTDTEIVLMPIGYCHHDDVFLKTLAKASGGALKYADVYSIYDMISVMAACDMFVGTSMHGNITAFSFGIPHMFAPIHVDKAEGFLDVVGLPRALKIPNWAALGEQLDMLNQMSPSSASARIMPAKQAVYAVMKSLCAHLLSEQTT